MWFTIGRSTISTPTKYLHRPPVLISSCITPPPVSWRNIVAASAAQAAELGHNIPHVHYGIDLSQIEMLPPGRGPLAHVAKIMRYKAQHRAIFAARRAGIPLDIVGNIESLWYMNLVVRPLIWLTPGVHWRGEAADTASALRNAKGLVQTPSWSRSCRWWRSRRWRWGGR